MIISFLPKNKPSSLELIVHDFTKGTQGKVLPISWWITNKRFPSDTTRVVTAGILRGGGDLLKKLNTTNMPYYYIDHAYFKAERGRPPGWMKWMRVTANGFNCTKITDTDSTKFNKLFDSTFQLSPWRKDGQTILILPPTDPVKYVFGCHGWLDSVLTALQGKTSRQIVIRTKPGEVLVDDTGKETGRTPFDPAQLPLDAELSRAHCVIAYNSSVTIQAAIKGIPVICSEQCSAYPISNNMSDIEDLLEFDRLPWLYNLCNHQFETQELLSGDAYRYLEAEEEHNV